MIRVCLTTSKSYLVLSGGLGSSPYVQERLQSHFRSGPGIDNVAARGMEILVAEEPYDSKFLPTGLLLTRTMQTTFGSSWSCT